MTARHPEPLAVPAAEPSASSWALRFEMDEPDGVVVVATRLDGETVAMASAGPSRDEDAPTGWELYSINVLATHQGSGVADQVCVSVIGRRPAMLWVGRDNPRAQAFYRRHGFAVEGATRLHEDTGAPELRMTRPSGRPGDSGEPGQPGDSGEPGHSGRPGR